MTPPVRWHPAAIDRRVAVTAAAIEKFQATGRLSGSFAVPGGDLSKRDAPLICKSPHNESGCETSQNHARLVDSGGPNEISI